MDESRLAAELARRHGVTTRQRIRALGVSDRVVARLVERGRMRLAGHGVLVDCASPATPHQRVAIACASTGGAASFPTSGELWSLRGTPRRAEVHMTIPWERRVRPVDGVIVRRSRHLPASHLVVRADGITVTAPPRTVIDAAGFVSAQVVESMVEQGIDREMFIVPTLWRFCRELVHSSRTGTHAFARILGSRPAWIRPVRSNDELRLERAMHRRGFPRLVREHPVHLPDGSVVHPDLGLPDDGFLVEVDHFSWHGGRIETAYDRWRDRKLRLTGVHVERVTDLAIETQLSETVDDLWALWQAHRGNLCTAAVQRFPR